MSEDGLSTNFQVIHVFSCEMRTGSNFSACWPEMDHQVGISGMFNQRLGKLDGFWNYILRPYGCELLQRVIYASVYKHNHLVLKPIRVSFNSPIPYNCRRRRSFPDWSKRVYRSLFMHLQNIHASWCPKSWCQRTTWENNVAQNSNMRHVSNDTIPQTPTTFKSNL